MWTWLAITLKAHQTTRWTFWTIPSIKSVILTIGTNVPRSFQQDNITIGARIWTNKKIWCLYRLLNTNQPYSDTSPWLNLEYLFEIKNLNIWKYLFYYIHQDINGENKKTDSALVSTNRSSYHKKKYCKLQQRINVNDKLYNFALALKTPSTLK